jgi:hypothetical protein
MTLDQKQIDWITNEIGTVANLAAEADEAANKKQYLADARKRIEQSIGTIKVGEDFAVVMKTWKMADFVLEKLDKRKKLQSIGKKADPNEDLDTVHDLPKVEGMDAGDFTRLMEAQSIIVEEAEGLRKLVNKAKKQPLFTEREISDAIWEPLKRRKLVAENAIPDRYSEVSQTFAGASEAYQERLAAYTDGLGKFEKLAAKMGVAKDVIDACASTATTVVQGLAQNGVNINLSLATDIIKLTTATLSGSLDAGQTLARKGLTADTANAFVNAALGMATASVSTGLDRYGDWGETVATAVNNGLRFTVKGGSFIAKCKKKDFTGAFQDLGDAIGACCQAIGSSMEAPGKSKTDDSEGATGYSINLGEVGTIIGDAVGKVPSVAKFIKACKDGDVTAADLASLFNDVLKEAVDASAKWWADQEQNHGWAEVKDGKKKANDQRIDDDEESDRIDKVAGEDAFDGMSKIFAELQKKKGPELEDFLKANPQLKKLAETVKKQQESVIEDAVKNMDKEIQDEAKKFRALLRRGETGDEEGDEDIESIEEMILVIKRDQMLLELAGKLAGMTAQVVAAFLPQAGIAVSAVDLMKNFALAAQHLFEYAEWLDNAADARSAMSVQVEAMINRADLSSSQALEASIKVLENAVLIVGGALSLAGPYAPAGHIATTVAKGTIVIKDVIVKFYKAYQLKKNWELYEKALTNPGDRKLVRKAIRKNPTLAKYVIAYGAEEGNNPIARNVMRKCGLSGEVLDSKEANVQKVEAFLEALYPEDPVILVAVSRPEEWWPGPVEFSSACLISFVGAAENKKKDKLKKGQCTGLISGFTAVETLAENVRKLRNDWMKAGVAAGNAPNDPQLEQASIKALHALEIELDALVRAVGSLYGDLNKFTPLDDKKKPETHKEMAYVIGLLTAKAKRLQDNYKRDADVLAKQDGAMERDWGNGRLA